MHSDRIYQAGEFHPERSHNHAEDEFGEPNDLEGPSMLSKSTFIHILLVLLYSLLSAGCKTQSKTTPLLAYSTHADVHLYPYDEKGEGFLKLVINGNGDSILDNRRWSRMANIYSIELSGCHIGCYVGDDALIPETVKEFHMVDMQIDIMDAVWVVEGSKQNRLEYFDLSLSYLQGEALDTILSNIDAKKINLKNSYSDYKIDVQAIARNSRIAEIHLSDFVGITDDDLDSLRKLRPDLNIQ